MTSRNTSLGTGLNIGGVISRTFATLFKNPLVFFGLAFIIAVPSTVLNMLVPESGPLPLLVNILEMILGFIVQGAITYAVYQVMKGNAVGIGGAVKRGTAVLLPLVLTSILITLGMGVGLALFVIPGLILMCMWLVAIPACVVERTGPIESLQRSAFLTKGFRWQVFALVILTFVLVLGLIGIVGYIVTAVTGYFVVGALAAGIIGIVPQAFAAVLYAIVYYDLRVIKEGASLDSIAGAFD